MEARDEKRLIRFQKHLASFELLIVDELGFVPLSKTGAEMLFEIFSQRYERSATMVTSNLKCGATHFKFNAVNIFMLGSHRGEPCFCYFDCRARRIKDRVVRDAINLSLARKRPDFSFGGVTASRASRLIDGSARV